MLAAGCTNEGSEAAGGAGATDGPAYQAPEAVAPATFDAAAATATPGGSIDVSHVAQGYVAASAANQGDVVREVYTWIVNNIT